MITVALLKKNKRSWWFSYKQNLFLFTAEFDNGKFIANELATLVLNLPLLFFLLITLPSARLSSGWPGRKI